MRHIDPEFIVTQPFQRGDLIKYDGSPVLRDPTSILTAVGSSVIGNAVGGMFGGGGGSGGGNAPPVYIPTNQQGMDQSFQDAYKQYQNAVNSYYGTTNPLNQQLLSGQFNNPYGSILQNGANMAGMQYGTTANQGSAAANNLFQNAADTSQWASWDRNGMVSRAPDIANTFSGMMGMANQSNSTYADLINQQRGQQGNVQGITNQLYGLGNDAATMERKLVDYQSGQLPTITNASNQLYGAGGKALNTADALAAYQMGQGGNVQGAANDLYGAARAIGNTAFDPQSALYEQNKQQLVDSVRAGEYARGIQMSPYGASVEADALGKFQNDWQNQQLARQAQGVSAMSGASQSAQGLGANWANEIGSILNQGVGTSANANQSALGLGNSLTSNISALQGQGISNVAGAGQAAQGMNNSYLGSLADLTNAMGSNYKGLAGGAANLLENWSQSQANVANTFGSALGQDYRAAAGLGDTAAQMFGASGQTPYNANQAIYSGQNQALGNFSNNNSPYLTGLGNLQSQASTYIDHGNIAQNQAFNQNMDNANFSNKIGQQLAPAISQGINSIWNGGAYAGQNTGIWGQSYVPTSSDVSALFGSAGYG